MKYAMPALAALALTGGAAAYGHAFPGPAYVIQDLNPSSGTITWAHAINNQGQIVGFADDANGTGHAVMFAGGKIVDLGVLPGATGGSGASSINAWGDAVGGAAAPDGASHAALFTHGRVIDLGVLPGFPISYAESINNQGVISGWVADATVLDRHAVVWIPAHRSVPPLKPLPRPMGLTAP